MPTAGVAPTQPAAATATTAPVPTTAAAPTQAASDLTEFEEAWATSGHADAKAEAFNHWNEEEDKVVPVTCAACHSTPGYHDFLGADGSEAGVVDKPAPLGTTITCSACHNDATANLTSVKFLSGVEITNLGPEARCMVCHQGRATKVQVDEQIAKFNATDPDAVVAPITEGDKTTKFGFLNIHYYAAAITLYGSEVKGGYEYEGKIYDAKFQHTEGYATCVECHDPHTTAVKVDQCTACHEDVKTTDDLKNIRMISSARDYNGNGDVKEGMYAEVAGLRDALYQGIQAYAKDVLSSGVIYDGATYPYFLLDKDGDGQADKDDKGATLGFTDWTPRLLKAAYNYQVSVKDPGAFAHGNKYIVQLLYDSLEDLNTKLTTKVDMTKMARDDAGHFAGNTMAFRDWDADNYTVPATCSKCHTATGMPQFIKEGANISNHSSNGFMCSTCHDESAWPANYKIANVTFPSGAVLTFGEGDKNNVCIECHQGRESTVSVNKAVANLPADTPSDKIRFKNIHYFAAGATLFGSEAQGIYQYPNKEYAGRFMHEGKLNTCTSCHDAHVLTVKTDTCEGCHQVKDPAEIRMNSKDDYDGDGNTTEGLKGELETYQEKLYGALQAYAKDVSKVGLVYDAAAYPYFFVDADGDGKGDVNAEGAGVAYNAWTPRLLEAAYNYQYSIKDPGAYAHNAHYVIQALYDSLADLKTRVPATDMTGLIRPQ